MLIAVSVVSIAGCTYKEDSPDNQLSSRLIGKAQGCEIYYIDRISGYLAKCEGSSAVKYPVGKSQVSTISIKEESN